jgi:hypothetical protein
MLGKGGGKGHVQYRLLDGRESPKHKSCKLYDRLLSVGVSGDPDEHHDA